MEPIIKVENLGKSYLIGHQRESYTALRDVLTNKARQAATNAKKFFTGGQLIAGNEMEEFWALKDINFEVNQGDRVGIIGRNGAGKSTLLKVLSRITEPTTGRIRLKGRVASLLEVGTGFHPELSGRENIYLNGAILGMGRAEVRKKFDEIVDFAGVEKFLDTPVKRYSSGMYVRLAFAVAAHLEPEILIVDEVLAVGDAEFQKKCLGKMEDVSKNDGRTVLFVSHNMGAIQNLCLSALFLENGKITCSGEVENVVNNYFSTQNSKGSFKREVPIKSSIYIENITILNDSDLPTNLFTNKDRIRITTNLNIKESVPETYLLITILDRNKRKIFSAEKLIGNAVQLSLDILPNFLTRGNYSLQSIIYKPAIAQFDNLDDICSFEVIDTGSNFTHLEKYDYGTVFGRYEWI